MITSLSGTPLSPLTFGTMQFGGNADADQSRAMFDAARAAGITHFDTAFVYTGGASETLLGEMAQADRDDLIIATKAAYDGGSGRKNILEGFATSQQRLQMDVVDILYLHRFDDNTPLPETFDALATLKTEGKIRHIGVSQLCCVAGDESAGRGGTIRGADRHHPAHAQPCETPIRGRDFPDGRGSGY